MTDANPDSTLKLLSDADDVVEELRELLGEFTAWRADVGQAYIVTPTITLDVLARTTILLESLRTAANELQKALDGHGTDRADRGLGRLETAGGRALDGLACEIEVVEAVTFETAELARR